MAELAAKKGLRDGIKTRKDALFAELNQCQVRPQNPRSSPFRTDVPSHRVPPLTPWPCGPPRSPNVLAGCRRSERSRRRSER